ncbi:hypothetical protein OH76DRAFT_1362817 [Lentinus brumalis]|uniref:F-box domain-containing protein n=1 Tax=Lentinus brumalis TaxID=2498619 RepID=A0A371CQ62_9APHY|nr:hypothetical protein OH76DRAFT_1362817 [Polyporus brumalis]
MDHRATRSWAHIDELLAMIFSYLDDRALARAACVCKHWSEIALDCLWFEVNDLKRVLSVLAPLTLKPERVAVSTGRLPGAYAFKRSLLPADWVRFQRYSVRVRRLRHDHRHLRSAVDRSAKRPALIHSKVFDELAATCTTSNIFPNLQSLIWYPSAPERQRLCLVFLHRRVKHLGLHLYRSEPPSLTDFISQICAQCPAITNLDLCLEEHMGNFEDYAVVLLRGLPHLQGVSVPIYGLTPRLLTELSRLNQVATINLTHPARAEPGNRADVAHFFPAIANNAFPALRNLSFSAQVEHATQLLRSSFFPAQLTELHLKAIVIATPHALQDLFSAIRDRCTSLVQLSVDYIIAPDARLTSPPPPLHERPNIATFRPLFSARCLRTFEFRWDYALAISDEDMEEYASSWPSLESLQFNPEPVPEPDVPGLNLRVLLSFARYCPNIRHLGLHVDARTIPNLAPTPRSQSLPRFRRLETLAVGLSAITKSEPVTLFLSQILPLGCTIVFGLRWPDAFDIAMEHALVPVCLRAEMSNNHVRWNEVSRMLPIATKARMEEKAHIEALERQMMELEVSRKEDRQKLNWLEQEVQDLRGRTGRTP